MHHSRDLACGCVEYWSWHCTALHWCCSSYRILLCAQQIDRADPTWIMAASCPSPSGFWWSVDILPVLTLFA
jgi:hypothetical protein